MNLKPKKCWKIHINSVKYNANRGKIIRYYTATKRYTNVGYNSWLFIILSLFINTCKSTEAVIYWVDCLC